jgi:hypothetical protein
LNPLGGIVLLFGVVFIVMGFTGSQHKVLAAVKGAG